MDKQQQQLHQMAAIADSEPLGGTLFTVHIGLLISGAITAYLLFDYPALAFLVSLYGALFFLEKWVAAKAVRDGHASMLPITLMLLFTRASAYNLIIVNVWMRDGDIFEMAALALIVASTINIMVHHPTYVVNMACVVIPKWLTFATISYLIFQDLGLSPEFVGSLLTIAFITPYFYLSLVQAHRRWSDLSSTRRELLQSQRLDGMGKVAGGVSHDFNNILSVVSGSLQLLESASSQEERDRLIEVASRAIEHGATLNRHLIALGKRAPLLPKPVDLSAAVQEFKEFAARVLPESILVETSAQQETTILADAGMLQSAMLNVALNAKAAMPNGGMLSIEARRAEPHEVPGLNKGNFAVLTISDTGQGMDKETADQAFEPFFTTREIGGGSGLGLSMVKGFAEQSNGIVKLDSEPGLGTSIAIFLPVTNQPIATHSARSVKKPASQTVGSKPKVMLVEDNPQFLDILTLKLERDGFLVVACTNGDDAISKLRENNDLRLVVSDLVMPGKAQGADLLSDLRSKGRQIPFLAISGYADLKDGNGSEVIGAADAFLEKPFDLMKFSEEVQSLLKSANSSG